MRTSKTRSATPRACSCAARSRPCRRPCRGRPRRRASGARLLGRLGPVWRMGLAIGWRGGRCAGGKGGRTRKAATATPAPMAIADMVVGSCFWGCVWVVVGDMVRRRAVVVGDGDGVWRWVTMELFRCQDLPPMRPGRRNGVTVMLRCYAGLALSFPALNLRQWCCFLNNSTQERI